MHNLFFSETWGELSILPRIEEGLKKLDEKLDEGLKKSDEKLDEGLKKLDEKLDEGLKKSDEKFDAVIRISAASTFRAFDAYDLMTETSKGKSGPKQEKIRIQYYDHCGISNDPDKEGSSPASCVLTNRRGKLKLAHLLPASTRPNILETLKISEDEFGLWSIRNVLLLCWNIEKYFDKKKLSFLQSPLQSNIFLLKIWDPTVAEELIFDGAKEESVRGDNKIGFYEDKPLQLVMPNGIELQPFKRCLSYQAFICFWDSQLLNDAVPRDFSSFDETQTWLSKRGDLLLLRKSLQKTIDQEVEEQNQDIDHNNHVIDPDEVSLNSLDSG